MCKQFLNKNFFFVNLLVRLLGHGDSWSPLVPFLLHSWCGNLQSAPFSVVLRVPHSTPLPRPNTCSASPKTKELVLGKARTAITGSGSRVELWSPPPALISCCYKQSGGWQLKASAHHSQPGWQPRWMDMESGERCRSLPAVPSPRVPFQRPAGGTIPLPLRFQVVD